MIEPKIVAHAPGDIVIGAGGISADSNAANNLLARPVECQPPPKTLIPPVRLPTMGSLAVP